MRPIPAPRIGDAHGLLRAISERDRVRLDEFVTEFSVDELFPPGLENALGRTRQFVSFARAAGLVKEDRGVVELTEIGKRYVKSADRERFFEVSSGQAEWLRRQLREKHMTDSIYHGAAIGLSLLSSSPPDFRVGTLDFGRALAYLARAGWDNDNTFQSQGERYVWFLQDLELIDQNWRLTQTGDQTRAELTLPIHMSIKDLAGQLNPGGVDAAVSEGEAEWRERDASAAASAPVVEAPEAPTVPPMSHYREDEYEDFGAEAAPAPEPQVQPPPPPAPAPAPEPVAQAPRPPGPPPVPADLWDTAAPDEVTRSYGTVSPEQAAAAATHAVGAEAAPGVRPAAQGAAPGVPPAAQGAAPGAPPAPGAPAAPGAPPAGGVAPPLDPLRRAAEAATRLSQTPPPQRAVSEGPATSALRAARAAAQAPAAAGRAHSGFIDPASARSAGEEAGLRLPSSVYAAAVAALATGRHVVLTGPAGSGKTTLALALARAAAAGGRASGAVLVTALRRWGSHDTLGRMADAGFQPGHVVVAAQRERWLVLDELDRAHLDRALGALSTFLGGMPATLPDGSEIEPPPNWRVIATVERALDGSAALRRRFAVVRVPAPDERDLGHLIETAASGDAVAAAAARRLLGVRELGDLGAGVFVAAARHAAERNALEPAGEAELAREVLDAYVRPLLGALDADAEARLRALVP